MKKSYLLLASMTLLLLGCEKDPDEFSNANQPQKDIVEEGFSFGGMSTDAAVINGAGGSTRITVTAQSDWTLTSNAEWLTFSPASGKAGTHTITVTSAKNNDGKERTGDITVSGSTLPKLSICQRPYIYSRKQSIAGNVSNSVTCTYSNIELNWMYFILPLPKTNMYQDISNMLIHSAQQHECPDSVNSYITVYCEAGGIPASGRDMISESFHAVAYEVKANLDLIKNIPAYDPESEPCKKYLGKEDGDLINPTNSTIATLANNMWQTTNGDLIKYARKCYEWTAQNINYGNMNTGLHTISDLMSSRTGDCGNFSSVFISLLRAKGIPARHIVMISPQELGYHVRAEFYIPGYGWIPADPTFKNSNPSGDYFGKFTGQYVVVSFGVNLECRQWDDEYFTASLLQSYCYWYSGYGVGPVRTQHSFSRFQ